MENFKTEKEELYDEKRRIELNIKLIMSNKKPNFIHLRRFHTRLINVNHLLNTIDDIL